MSSVFRIKYKLVSVASDAIILIEAQSSWALDVCMHYYRSKCHSFRIMKAISETTRGLL